MEQLVSAGTLVTICVGVVIGYVYIRYMWGALQRAVRTRNDEDRGQDRYRHGLAGAGLAVVGSIAAIAVDGVGPKFLYVGPTLALASAVAVAYCLRVETLEE